MYRIVAYNPDGSSYTIYDPAGSGALPVRTPRTTEELNEAGSLEFILLYGHPAFGHLVPKKTYVTAELDGNEYFYGRLLNAEPNPMAGQITYTFAGALSFLQDSEIPPDPKKEDGTTDSETLSAAEFFVNCILHHNSEVGDARRQFSIGVIDHSRMYDEREYQISSYTETLSALKQNILDRYGGFFRIRKVNGGHAIDWVEQYGDTDASTVELGQNILSVTNRMNADGLVTAIRPVGKDNLVLSGGGIMDIYSSGEMAEYGRIVKSLSFPAAETEEELESEAQNVIDRIHKTIYINSDINLVDLHFVEGVRHPVNLGDVYTNIVGLSGIAMTVANRSRDMESPQNDSISLKNPKSFEGDETGGEARASGLAGGGSGGGASTSSLTQQAAQNSSAQARTFKHIKETDDRLEMTAKEIYIAAEQLEIHADMFVETANEFARLSHKEETLEGKMGIIEGTGVIQNSEHITQIAGKFQYDPDNNVLELIDGSELKVHDRNGVSITVGTRLTELGQKTAAFEGSALWTQRENITGIVGEFEIKTVNGVRTLVIKSGGGINIRRNNVEFGLYDEGSLTGGIVVDKINQNSGGQQIEGTRVNITANQVHVGSTSNVAAWMTETGDDINNLQGLVADRATIAQLNAQKARIDSIITNYLKTTDLKASIANIAELNVQALSVASLTSNRGGVAVNSVSANEYKHGGITVPLYNAIVSATVDGNVLTLTNAKGDAVTFSKATSLSGAWSGDTYTVTASPQGNTNSVKIGCRLNGSAQYSNFSAEAGTGTSSGFVARATIRGYLTEHVSGASSYVDVNSGSSSGGVVARISTAATYNAGKSAGYDSAHLSASWNGGTYSVTKVNTGTTNTTAIVISAGISYDSSSHKYTAYAKTGTTQRGNGVTSGTEAYDAGYSAGYNAGNSAGYSSGYSAGHSAGYDAGEETGYTNGYAAGKKKGWNDCVDTTNANKYWFVCYTGTVATKYDAPTGGASSRQVIYPYETANHYRYTLPDKK